MNKRIVLLTIAVVITAITVIELRHRNRLMFAGLQALQQERDELNIEWGKLLLEEGAWSQYNRVETIARNRLGMSLPGPDQVVVLRVPGGKDQ